MKLHFNNKEYFFNNKNISSYHLLLKSLEKIGEKWQNIDNYYITTAEGFPIKPSQVIEENRSYYLKRRMRGSSSLYEKGNSYVITILGSIFFGILSIVYYNFYLRKILIQIPEDIKIQLYTAAAPNTIEPVKKTFKGMKNLKQTFQKLPKGLRLEGKMPKSMGKGLGEMSKIMKGGLKMQNVKTQLSNFGIFVKKYWNNFLEIVEDDKINLYLCNISPITPSIVLEKKQNSWSSILSFALFSTYIFMLLMPMITNAATTISCKSPGFSKLGIPLLLLLIPLILIFAMPYLIKLLNIFGRKFTTNPPNFDNYRLAISNTILIVILLIYLIGGKNNISPLMGCMVIIGLIIFALLKYIPTLNNIFESLSKTIGNWITNTKPIPEYVDEQNARVSLNSGEKLNFQEAAKEQQPDCWMRYRFIFDLLWTIVMTLVGWGLMVGVYASQVRKHCKVV